MDCIPNWNTLKDLMSLYIDSAKTFLSLSTAALTLTIIFREKIVGAVPGERLSRTMICSWVFFLLTATLSAFYQYLAVNYLDIKCRTSEPGADLWHNPGYVYGVMLCTFLVGCALLAHAAVQQMPRRNV